MNVDFSDKRHSDNYLRDVCDTFSMENIISGKTCIRSVKGTSIDVMLTNRSRVFYSTIVTETGLSDCHKLIASFFRAYLQIIPPKTIEYRKFNFHDTWFLYGLDLELIKGNIYNYSNDQYDVFTAIFRQALDKHSPLKRKS